MVCPAVESNFLQVAAVVVALPEFSVVVAAAVSLSVDDGSKLNSAPARAE
jgi:hypothetical protein